MTFELRIEMDNAAFEESPDDELARILRHVAQLVENGDRPDIIFVRDINGNFVGGCRFHK